MSAPIIAGSKTLSYTESGTAISITTKILNANDADSAASALKFKVTPGSDANGFFYLSSAPTVKVSEFTLNDVSSGKVFFKPGTSSTPPVINVTVNDGTSDSVSSSLIIEMKAVNDLASFTASPLSITEGATIDMKGKLSATDEDSTPSQLIYSVSGTLAGSFLKGGKVVTKFSQDDVDKSLITFKHDGSEIKPIINFTLTDAGGAKSAAQSPVVTFTGVNDAAVISGSKTLSYTESGAAINITTKILNASDAEGALNTALKFNVSSGSDANGFFFLGTAKTVKVTEFTLKDVIDGKVFFQPGSSSTAPQIKVKINDGTVDSDESVLTVKMKAVNDLASFTASPLSITEGATIDMKGKLSATDEDSTPSQLIYSVSGTLAGSFLKGGKVVTKFSQDDVDKSLITFKHDGSEIKPIINFTLTDAGGAKSAAQSPVVTFTGVNDAAVISGSKTLSYTESGAAINITTKILNASDAEGALNTALKFNVSSGSDANGFFFLGTAKTVKVTEFTLKDVIDGKVFFQPGSSSTAPQIKVKINDGTVDSDESVLTVKMKAVNDLASFTASPLSITEGATIDMKGKLSATDEDSTPSQLIYSVSGTLAGSFLKGGKVVTKFSQDDVDKSLITFKHDGSDRSPVIKFTLTDAGGAIQEKTPAIDFIHLATSGESDLGTDANEKFSYDGNFVLIDGGKGDDTLVVSSALNLSGVAGVKLKNLEGIQLGSTTLTLSAADVLALSGTSDQVKIDGSDTATVDLDVDAWGSGVIANGYTTYRNGGATLVIDSDIHVV
jgi:hypothetical protein